MRKRRRSSYSHAIVVIVAALVFSSIPWPGDVRLHADTKVWRNTADGLWQDPANWENSSPPAANGTDGAAFNLTGEHVVVFNVVTGNPTINFLFVGSGTAQLRTSDFVHTLQVLGTCGTQGVAVSDNATLMLGNGFDGSSSPMQLAAGGLASVEDGGQFVVAANSNATLNGVNIGVETLAASSMTVDGPNSLVTLVNPNPLTVGNAIGGTGVLHIGDMYGGGEFDLTSNTSVTNVINPTGTVYVGGGNGSLTGRLNVNSDVTVSGGRLHVGAFGSLVVGSGRTVNVQDGGRLESDHGVIATNGAHYSVAGAGSKLDISDYLLLSSTSSVNVGAGGMLSTGELICVGSLGGSGAGATISASPMIIAGGTGSFGQSAVVSCDSLQITDSASTNGSCLVQNGATLNVSGNSQILVNAENGHDSTLTVNAGSVSEGAMSWLQMGNGSLFVMNNGAFNVGAGGSTYLNSHSIIDIETGGRVDLKSLAHDDGGQVHFNSGSLSYIGRLITDQNAWSMIALNGTVGSLATPSKYLDANQTLDVTGTITNYDLLGLLGATLKTTSLVNNGVFDFQSGTLDLGATGGIDGYGILQTGAGTELAAHYIIQSTLAIGGTAGNPARVTIGASDANGNSLFAPGAADGADLWGAPFAVPEPSTLSLLFLGAAAMFLTCWRRRAAICQ